MFLLKKEFKNKKKTEWIITRSSGEASEAVMRSIQENNLGASIVKIITTAKNDEDLDQFVQRICAEFGLDKEQLNIMKEPL